MDKEGRVKGLRCYTCNIEGFPACDDPFALENGRLANCTEDREDGRVELCAKIMGTVISVSSDFSTESQSTSNGSVSTLDSNERTIRTGRVMNATSEAIVNGRNFSLANYSFASGDYYFGRTCFPIGDGWVWRREPYNETFILGDLTISASVYICRNTRCNSGEGKIILSSLRHRETIIMTILLAVATVMLMSFIRDIIL